MQASAIAASLLHVVAEVRKKAFGSAASAADFGPLAGPKLFRNERMKFIPTELFSSISSSSLGGELRNFLPLELQVNNSFPLNYLFDHFAQKSFNKSFNLLFLLAKTRHTILEL